MKRVYRAASLLQVAHARNVLITAGIRCELRNQYLAGAMGELPMMETWPQLYVDDADERYALGVLARAAAGPGRRSLDLRRMRREPRAAVHLMLALRAQRGTAGRTEPDCVGSGELIHHVGQTLQRYRAKSESQVQPLSLATTPCTGYK